MTKPDSTPVSEKIAKTFLMQALQHWGQSDAEREKATKDYVLAAGFKYPSSEGRDWLRGVLINLRRGEFFDEIKQLQAALDEATR